MRSFAQWLLILLCAVSSLGQTQPQRTSSVEQSKSHGLPKELIAQLLNDDIDVRKFVREGNDPAKHFDAIMIDLNDDGQPEYEITESNPASSPFCGVSGLCTFWLYRKVGQRWQSLLSAGGGLVQLKTRTKGFRDISNDSWGGALDKYTTIYKFDGERYRAAECLEYKAVQVGRGPFRWKLVRRGPCRR